MEWLWKRSGGSNPNSTAKKFDQWLDNWSQFIKRKNTDSIHRKK